MSVFGLWLGAEYKEDPDPKKDEKGRQRIIGKGSEKPLIGERQYYFLILGLTGPYHVNRETWDKFKKGDWITVV